MEEVARTVSGLHSLGYLSHLFCESPAFSTRCLLSSVEEHLRSPSRHCLPLGGKGLSGSGKGLEVPFGVAKENFGWNLNV